MTVNAIPMAKQTKEEVIENDLGKTLKSSKITSEIDFLKRMKLKQQISVAATTSGDASLKAIADFQSTDDKRVQEVYSKLIAMYQSAEDEKRQKLLNLLVLYKIGQKEIFSLTFTLNLVIKTFMKSRQLSQKLNASNKKTKIL